MVNLITEENKEEFDLQYLLKSFWREKFIIFICIIIGIFFGSYYLKNLSEPGYKAVSIFGFENNQNQNKFSGFTELQNFFGTDFQKPQDDLLTQISSGVFLKKVVLALELHRDEEFYKISSSEKKSYSHVLKHKIKTFLNIPIIKNDNHTFDEQLYITTNNLKKKLSVNSIDTGGYEVIVTTTDPKKSSKISNTITEKFLEYHFNNNIIKSEKALSYLSEKLKISRKEMDLANNAVEIFALEKNVLSNQEFRAQSNQLKEFRISIKKMTDLLTNIENIEKILDKDISAPEDLIITLDSLYSLIPRLKLSMFNSNEKRNIEDEVKYVKKLIPNERKRISESLKSLIQGFKDLEKTAKATSADARELRRLKRASEMKAGNYEALFKQFESQSFLEGYKDSIGQVYEFANPPTSRIFPSVKRTILFSTVLGLLAGITLAFSKILIFSKVYDYRKLSNIFVESQIISLSNLNNANRLLTAVSKENEKINPNNKDLIPLQSLVSNLVDHLKKNSFSQLAFGLASAGKSQYSMRLAVYLLALLEMRGKSVLIIDFSFTQNKTEKLLKSITSSRDNKNSFKIGKKSFYHLNSKLDILSNENKVDQKKLSEIFLQDFNVIISVVDQIESLPSSAQRVINNDFFTIIFKAGQLNEKEIIRIKSSLTNDKDRNLYNVFVN